MKRNAFGESILQHGDDVGLAFMEAFGTDISECLFARFIEHDENFGWTCTISDPEGNEIEAHDFESEAQLREWLSAAAVSIED